MYTFLGKEGFKASSPIYSFVGGRDLKRVGLDKEGTLRSICPELGALKVSQ